VHSAASGFDCQDRRYVSDLAQLVHFLRARARARARGSSDVLSIDNKIIEIVSSINEDHFVDYKTIIDVIHVAYVSGFVWIAESISSKMIASGIHREPLEQALELGRKGEMIKAAYVARGHTLYNEKFADSFSQVVPPVVQDEIAAQPPTARILDLGCGTGLVGGLCRSLGYDGHLAGLDLVEEMVAAVPPNTYDRTISADAGDWLAANAEKWDAVLSFGVFVHFDLSTVERVLALIADRLRDHGFLAFNAAEGKATFGHALPLSDLGGILDRVGLYLDAMVRREERTTYLCRKG
jgi:2-polyprenyl-3-methyl-5-hydroxy-6-metoxy-1,4-benzoquinol methylase